MALPLGSDAAWLVLLLAALVGGAGFFAFTAWRTRSKVHAEAPAAAVPPVSSSRPVPDSGALDVFLLERAADALGRHDSEEARRLSEEQLRRNPDDVDVLLILAASYAQQGAHADVVRVLEPHTTRGPEPHPSLAYLLSLSYANLGEPANALRWLLVAARDPELRPHIEEEPALQRVRAEPLYRRLLGVDGLNLAYA